MKKIRLSANEKRRFQKIGEDAIDLRYNWPRRFQNALLCLTLSDPHWITWIEREIDPEKMSLPNMTRLIEARARLIILKPYGYFGRKCIGNYIFRDDWAFTDRGNLSPG